MGLLLTAPSTRVDNEPPNDDAVQVVNVTYVNVNGVTDDVPSPYAR
jgi:hypothetical protein